MIIEVSPKLKIFKNSSKDIISISFVSDNYSVKLENVEKAIVNNDKIIINIKEFKNKTPITPIKCSLIKNNNNIIAMGEFVPTEGVKWYKLNEVKNNMSKESLITSSTSNGNIKYNSNFSINKKNHNLSDVNHSYGSEPLINFGSKNNMNTSLTSNYINIKFSITFGNKAIYSSKNLTKNNYKEQSPISSKDDDILFDKDRDIFNDDDFTITESDISKINPKQKFLTSSKKSSKKIKFKSGKQSKKIIKFNISQSPIEDEPDIDIMNENLTIRNTLSNNKAISPIRKPINKLNKKYLNDDIKMKTSIGFNKRKNIFDKNLLDNKYKNKNSKEIPRKLNSCENIIEDEILDQNFKNYLKNDEILKPNISRNNSFNSLSQNNNKEFIDINNQNNNFNIPNTVRCNNNEEKDKEKENKRIIPQDSLYADLQLLKTNSDYEYALSNESMSKNIITNNDNIYDNINDNDNDNDNGNYSFEDGVLNNNYERLKTDFFLLYSDENLQMLNNETLFFELQLMIEKILILQKEHQKEYIYLFNSLNSNKNIFSNYQYQYFLLFKQINKLHGKKLYNDAKDKRKMLYNENINNFIDKRKSIINNSEFEIWDKMMENANRVLIKKNNKNKMINIFLNICEKNESHLNKLSLKFYKEIKNKINKSNNNIANKNNKYNTEKKPSNIRSRIKENELESTSPYLKTNYNGHNSRMNSKSNKVKFILSKKNAKRKNSNKNDINFQVKNTVANDASTNNHNYKKKSYKNKSSSIRDKIYHKKKESNKNQ